MSKWDKVRLGDIGAILTGNTPSTKNSEYFCSNDIPFYKPSDIEVNGITELHTPIQYIAEAARAKSRILPPESVLVTCIGTIGKVGITTTECACNQQINAIIPNRSICIHKYLAYSILSVKADLQAKANAPIVPIINKTNFSETTIPLPPLDEQRRIAKTLDAAADLLRLRKQQLAELEKLVKSRFIEMFGHPVSNDKGFLCEKLGDICTNLDSLRKPITASERKIGSYPYYGASGIVDYVNGYIFDEDILLISEDGANLLARVTPIAFSVSGKVWVNNHVHVVKFQNLATQKYVELHFSMRDISEFITGTAQPKLNQAKLNMIPIPVPPLSLQTKFAKFIQRVEVSKVLVQQAVDETQTLFDSLMSEYFE